MADSEKAEASESEAMRDIRAKFVGKWRLQGSENFEAFLQEMGAPYIARKMSSYSKPDCEISIVDDKVHVHTWTTFWSQDDHIQLGKPYERDIQKRKMKCLAAYEDGKIVNNLEPMDNQGKPQTVTRELQGDVMVVTIKVGDIVAKRMFGRV